MKKLLTLMMMVVLSLTMLCACTPKEKTEEEIKADLATHPSFFHAQEVEITEFEVIKRQTNAKEYSDVIYVGVSAENENIAFHRSYCMEYGLYDEGWILDSVTPTPDPTWSMVPKKGPDQALADIAVAENLEEGAAPWTFIEKQEILENGYCCFFYQRVESYNIKDYVHTCAVVYTFDYESAEWVLSEKPSEIEISWKLEGKWQGYHGEKSNMFDVFEEEDEEAYVLYFTPVEGDTFHVDMYRSGELHLSKDFDFRKSNMIPFKVGYMQYWIYVDTDIYFYNSVTKEYSYFQRAE